MADLLLRLFPCELIKLISNHYAKYRNDLFVFVMYWVLWLMWMWFLCLNCVISGVRPNQKLMLWGWIVYVYWLSGVKSHKTHCRGRIVVGKPVRRHFECHHHHHPHHNTTTINNHRKLYIKWNCQTQQMSSECKRTNGKKDSITGINTWIFIVATEHRNCVVC